jgi:hypothetical protein
MKFRHLGVLGSGLGAVGALCLALAACGGGTASGNPPDEKVASQSSALIQTNPNPPYPFPGSMPRDCERAPAEQLVSASGPSSYAWLYGENYVAFPTQHTCDPANPNNCDTSTTAYSHSYYWAEEGLSVQLASDFFGIPNANGYKYEVALLTQSSTILNAVGAPELVLSPKRFYLQGINRWDQGWLWSPPNTTLPPPGQQPNDQPWCYSVGGCPPGTAAFDDNSHPPDGPGADWQSLWNLAWTYSYTGDPYRPNPPDGPPGPYNPGPNNPPPNPNSSNIESEHHQCTMVYVCPGGQACNPQSPSCPSGQSCVLDWDGYNSSYECWAPCHHYDPSTGLIEVPDATGLVPWDFFPAAERHDPGCCSF